jgi:hypothetical protein
MTGMGMRYERYDDAEVTEFRVVAAPDELVPALQRSAFTERDGCWVRSCPAGTPHVDDAWVNFQRLAEPWLRQLAGLEPVLWEETLDLVCRRLDGIDWWLTGSAALAARGMAITPGDLDLVVSGADSHRAGELLLDGLVEPVAAVDWFCDWFGRAMFGARVEWAGGVGPAADQPEITDFGPHAAARLDKVRWRDHDIRVPPLDLQRAVNVRRGLTERVRLIDQFAD